MTSGIYAIIHRLSGKVYVGQSCNIEARWRDHRSKISNPHPRETRVVQAMRSDLAGMPVSEAFEFKILEEAQHLNAAEKAWWMFYKRKGVILYNVKRPGGEAGCEDEVTREKKRQAMLGRFISLEHAEKISIAMRGRPSPLRKPVVCLTTGEVFAHGRAASESLGVNKNVVQLSIAKLRTIKGTRWAYEGDEEAQSSRFAVKDATKKSWIGISNDPC